LGYRLNGLLNAMRLADLLGVEFRFAWPLRGQVPQDTTHAIVPAEDFFSADFLAAYRVEPEVASTGFVPPKGRGIDLDALRAQIAAADRGLLAPGSPLANRIDPKAVPQVARGFSKEFARIGFHRQIEEAISAAREVPLDPATVGIHLRAGDHMYGRFRLLNRFWDKTIPAPIARELIMRSKAEGSPVIVFGQDAELITELCETTGAVDAVTMRPTSLGDRSANAMFDLVLMSRCERILCGDSGFAVQAAAISDKQAEFHVDLITPEESLRITRSDLERNGDRYHPVQRAFAWWVAYYRVRHDIPYDEAAVMLSAAIDGDPENSRSRLRLAALSYRAGDVVRGDEVLTDALIADVAPGRDRLRSIIEFSRMRGRRFDSDEIVEDFERAAEAGSGPASLYRAAIRARRGEVEGAVADAAAFKKHAAAEPPLAGLAGFDALVEATMEDRLGEFRS
jgi:hypothetical protein